ncbi:serine/threonine-protein kinase [Leifsonia poae]|uniref:serine/threonine-protein kinase n=1 Tax=Leifsonia poae TaxID=110933 RepID=UPI003D6642F7
MWTALSDPRRSTTIDDLSGITLGDRFELLHVIGRGGMAAVYRARDTQLDRIVAVKAFSAGEASDDARRRAEAQTLARLNHPNLVTLFDAHLAAPGSVEPSYIVMELVDGPSLRDELDRGPLPPGEVGILAAELAEALVAVHAAGIVHRDLKPANILLALTGLPAQPYRGKLADFGIAHLIGSERITTDGVVIGTAAYLSPEQAQGAEPGPPSDIYALGLILIEALTGVRAFAGTPAEGIGARLVQDARIPPGLPAAWDELLTRMTARDPEARPDAVEVSMVAREHAADLAEWAPTMVMDATPTIAPELVATEPMTAPVRAAPLRVEPEKKPRRKVLAWVVAAGAVVVAGLVVVAAVLVNAPDPQSEPTHTPSTSTSSVPVAPVASNTPSPSLTPAPVPTTDGPVKEKPVKEKPAKDKGNGNGKGNGKG